MNTTDRKPPAAFWPAIAILAASTFLLARIWAADSPPNFPGSEAGLIEKMRLLQQRVDLVETNRVVQTQIDEILRKQFVLAERISGVDISLKELRRTLYNAFLSKEDANAQLASLAKQLVALRPLAKLEAISNNPLEMSQRALKRCSDLEDVTNDLRAQIRTLQERLSMVNKELIRDSEREAGQLHNRPSLDAVKETLRGLQNRPPPQTE